MLFDSEWWRAEYLGPTSREQEQAWDLEGFVRGARKRSSNARARGMLSPRPRPPRAYYR